MDKRLGQMIAGTILIIFSVFLAWLSVIYIPGKGGYFVGFVFISVAAWAVRLTIPKG